MARAHLSLVSSVPVPDPQPEPILWPNAHEKFGLSRLAEVSGVSANRIRQWQQRGAFKVRRIGRGRVRAYDIWDALLCALIAEMSELGLEITGKGESLSGALEGYVWHRTRSDRDLSRLDSLALIRDGADYLLSPLPACSNHSGSFVVIGLRNVVEGVARRYQAA